MNFIKLSIITPAFNRKHCLENYFSKLSRLTNINDCEILFVDDCSTDGTYEYAEERKQQFPNLRLFKTNVNSGAGVARNIGIKNASGDYIAFLDSDDWFVEDALEKLLKIAYGNPNENIIGGSINSVDKTGKILKSGIYGNRQTNFPLVDRHATYQECQFFYLFYTCIYKTSFLRDNNLYFKNYRSFDDPPFYIEALLKNDGQYVVDFSTYNYTLSDNYKKRDRNHNNDINKSIDYCMSIIPKTCTYVLKQLQQIKAQKNKSKKVRRHRRIRVKIVRRTIVRKK